MALEFDGVDSLIVDQQLRLFEVTPVIAGLSGTELIDVSQYQHVIVQFARSTNPVITCGPSDYLEFRWSPGNGLSFISERMSLSNKELNVADGAYTICLPVRGMSMQIAWNLTNAISSLIVVGSYRPCPPMSQKGNVICGTSGGIAAGDNFYQMKFPYRGACTLVMAGGVAIGNLIFLLEDQYSGQGFGVGVGAAQIASGQDYDSGGASSFVIPLALPFCFARMRVLNTGAANSVYWALIAN